MAFISRAWCCAESDIMSVAPLELWLMIATATLCMSPLAVVTGGDDSLDNDFVCDIAVPTSHGYTRAVWFEREAPSSLQPPAKFDSLFHENTRDGPGLCSTMAIVPGWSCSLVPVWICCTVSLRCAAGAFILCCALCLCLMHPRSLSFSQQCCGQDGVDIFLVNGAILHRQSACWFLPDTAGSLRSISFPCAGMGKSPSLTLVLGRK